jgi:hypothetical protein
MNAVSNFHDTREACISFIGILKKDVENPVCDCHFYVRCEQNNFFFDENFLSYMGNLDNYLGREFRVAVVSFGTPPNVKFRVPSITLVDRNTSAACKYVSRTADGQSATGDSHSDSSETPSMIPTPISSETLDGRNNVIEKTLPIKASDIDSSMTGKMLPEILCPGNPTAIEMGAQDFFYIDNSTVDEWKRSFSTGDIDGAKAEPHFSQAHGRPTSVPPNINKLQW